MPVSGRTRRAPDIWARIVSLRHLGADRLGCATERAQIDDAAVADVGPAEAVADWPRMFVVVGVVGAVLLVAFLLFDDVLDGILPDAEWISGPIIGAFLAAFGLFGWVADEGFDAPTPLAAAVGVLGGGALGWFAYRLSRALLHSPTDGTPTAAALVGQPAKVVTPVRAGGIGEVLVRLGGQPVKLSATASSDLPRGAETVVVAVESATRVRVESAAEFWNQ